MCDVPLNAALEGGIPVRPSEAPFPPGRRDSRVEDVISVVTESVVPVVLILVGLGVATLAPARRRPTPIPVRVRVRGRRRR